MANVTTSLDKLDSIQPKLLDLIPPQLASQQINRDLVMTNYATLSGIYDQNAAALENSTAMGAAFDAAKTDDSFYVPPEVFDNAEFQRGLKLFLSPDGKAARMIITHDVDPATPQGISHIDAIRHSAEEAVKGTPLAGSHIYIGGTAATYKDIQEGAKYDLIIVAIAAMSLILLIMMFITRSLVAAIVIVGTVALSLGASLGLSILVWQHILGIQLYWVIIPLADNPAAGSGFGLQPAADIPIQRRDRRRIEHRHHPRHGGDRWGRHRRGVGVRVHHGVLRLQRSARARPDRHNHRAWPVVRHPDRALVHDPVHRGASRAVVLVATASASASGQHDAATLWIPPRGASASAVGGRRRK